MLPSLLAYRSSVAIGPRTSAFRRRTGRELSCTPTRRRSRACGATPRPRGGAKRSPERSEG